MSSVPPAGAPARPPVAVTVVVPTFQRAAGLRLTLRSLGAQRATPGAPFEVLVVDDGSTDDTAAAVEEFAGPTVRYLRIPNGGVAGARNAGVRASRGTWIAFCDDDQIADPAWLASLLVAADRSGASVVGGARDLHFESGQAPPLGPLSRALLGEDDFGTTPRPYPPGALPNTGNALVRRGLFQTLGGFDEAFRQGGEDTEFFTRARNAGAAIWYAPEARVRHVIPPARVDELFLRWVASRIGVSDARIARKHASVARHLATMGWRAAAALAHATRGVAAPAVRRRADARVDARCGVAYNVAYLRGSLHLLLPRLAPQVTFLDAVDFRGHGGERILTS